MLICDNLWTKTPWISLPKKWRIKSVIINLIINQWKSVEKWLRRTNRGLLSFCGTLHRQSWQPWVPHWAWVVRFSDELIHKNISRNNHNDRCGIIICHWIHSNDRSNIWNCLIGHCIFHCKDKQFILIIIRISWNNYPSIKELSLLTTFCLIDPK